MLTEKQKLAYQMFYRDHLKQGVIARVLGVSRVAVARLLARARLAVKKMVEACERAGGDCRLLMAMLLPAA